MKKIIRVCSLLFCLHCLFACQGGLFIEPEGEQSITIYQVALAPSYTSVSVDVELWYAVSSSSAKIEFSCTSSSGKTFTMSQPISGKECTFTVNGLPEGETFSYKAALSHGKNDTNHGEVIGTFPTFPRGPVDLDLPSGKLWASENLGASGPCESGGYYAWGGTTTRQIYDWTRYEYGEGYRNLKKYVPEVYSYYGIDNYWDNLTKLEDGDDAANVALKGNWHIPTKDDWLELKSECAWQSVSFGKISGMIIRSKKAQSDDKKVIFLPYAGFRVDVQFTEGNGWYWSSELNDLPDKAYSYSVFFRELNPISRNYGLSIRPIQGK